MAESKAKADEKKQASEEQAAAEEAERAAAEEKFAEEERRAAEEEQRAAEEKASREFVVLHAMERNGVVLEPSPDHEHPTLVTFAEHEAEHVAELLERGIIAMRKHAKEALAAAEAAREATRTAPGTRPETGLSDGR